jgi:5-hydroxyisourate hydrolase-like protein (transthyretin family)
MKTILKLLMLSLLLFAPLRVWAQANTPRDGYQVHLPLVVQAPTSQVKGQVLEGGQPVGGVTLTLVFVDGSGERLQATTESASDGSYTFANVPPLETGEAYYVSFSNSTNAARLSKWQSARVQQLAVGDIGTVAPFDIGNVVPLSPANPTSTALPINFTWTPRAYAPNDIYYVRVEAANGNYWTSSYSRDINDHFLLELLPTNPRTGERFVFDTPYTWKVMLYNNGGWGWSFETRSLSFKPSPTNRGVINGHVTEGGQPVGGVNITLVRYNAQTWNRITTLTDAAGFYAFYDLPPVLSGEYGYAVQYSNPGDPARIGFWSTWTLIQMDVGEIVTYDPFDISDVVLGTPNSNIASAFPVDFTWTPRPAAPGDKYRVRLYSLTSSETWRSPLLGYQGHYQLTSMPVDPNTQVTFRPGVPYYWYISIYNDAVGGNGRSSYSYEIIFPGAQAGGTPPEARLGPVRPPDDNWLPPAPQP